MNDATDWPCEICLKPSRARVHDGCRDRLANNLLRLPALYRALAAELAPTRRGDGGRTGSRTAPLPVRLDVLDLRSRGGIEGILAGWVRDLCEREGWEVPQYGTVEATVDSYTAILIGNLHVLCDEHPAIREIAHEIAAIVRQCEAITTGEKPARRVAVTCPCGGVLRVTIDSPGARCPTCGQQYGHAEVLSLPLADRAAA